MYVPSGMWKETVEELYDKESKLTDENMNIVNIVKLEALGQT